MKSSLRNLFWAFGTSAYNVMELLTITPTQGGLALPDLRHEAPLQFAAITAPHVEAIIAENHIMTPSQRAERLK